MCYVLEIRESVLTTLSRSSWTVPLDLSRVGPTGRDLFVFVSSTCEPVRWVILYTGTLFGPRMWSGYSLRGVIHLCSFYRSSDRTSPPPRNKPCTSLNWSTRLSKIKVVDTKVHISRKHKTRSKVRSESMCLCTYVVLEKAPTLSVLNGRRFWFNIRNVTISFISGSVTLV